ncbi:MAG: hypothetical protein U5L06_00615 [Rhodovibrio sp.]|nr:hypothetical protein [Rhodovibrio sp.]
MRDPNWTGRTVACIASGPSLTPGDCERVRQAGLPTIAVNNAGLDMAPWADIHHACDGRWWHAHPEALAFDRPKFCLVDDPPAGVRKLNLVSGGGLDDRPDTVRAGQNSGYQALHLAAVNFGAARVILLGYDMQHTGGAVHYHGRHPAPLRNPAVKDMPGWVAHFDAVAPELERRGVDVLNASRATALTCFQRVALEEVLPCPV